MNNNKTIKNEKPLKVANDFFYGTGKRKSAIAKVWIFKGTGKVMVNNMLPVDYFCNENLTKRIFDPLKLLKLENNFDIKAIVLGGGKVSQALAFRLGVARAIVEFQPDSKVTVKKEGFLTRDPRVKERKKYGLRGARKAPQYRKR